MIEILAPVGGEEQLIAAVRSGADAVYMGVQGFNARQNAKNFSLEALPDVVRYCRQRGVKVHVTFNTLVFDSEIHKLTEHIEKIAMCGVDAVITQDMATARIVRDCCPELPLHASTQMTVHNSAGVRLAQKLGFSRVVLARELTMQEIEAIVKDSDIEIETFVHGALCTCVSGACYLSSMLGGRSGNRGYCAQPCRLDFRNSSGREYALSLKDMSLIKYAQKLATLGVSSLKIEGRMKRPEYVAITVASLRDALDGKEYDVERLESVFSRSGFTDGYIAGRRNVSMYGYRRKEDVEASAGVLGEIASLYRNERQSIPFDAEMILKKDEKAVLTVTDGENYVTVEGDVPEAAQRLAASTEYVAKSVSKTGGTPFALDNLNVRVDGNITLAASKINAMRKTALDELLKVRGALKPYKFDKQIYDLTPKNTDAKYKLRLRFERAEQICDVPCEYIILPIDEILNNVNLTEHFKNKLIAEIPPVLWEKDSKELGAKLSKLESYGIKDVMCSNLGAIEQAAKMGFIIHGDYGLNIVNSIALEEYENMGLSSATISYEASMGDICRLGGSIKRGIISYGYLPLMKLRVCPAQCANGCGSCNGRPYLTDKLGVKFPMLCKNRKYTELLNSVPLYIGDKAIKGVDFVTLYFTIETPSDTKNIIKTFNSALPYSPKHTNGLYFRAVK